LRQVTSANRQDHDPTWSPDGTQLVITSERFGTVPDGDVAKINVADGSLVANLTAGLEHGGVDPAWSPDGSQVAFFKRPLPITHAPQQLWVMDSNGTNRRHLETGCAINIHPNWGRAVDSDNDGRPDYLDLVNTSLSQGHF